jgi:hypothetical protein
MNMDLSNVASLSGKGGLFRILKPGKSGVILEAMDASKAKIVASMANKVSILSEISIYTTTKEGTVPLAEVLKKIYDQFGADPGVGQDDDPKELRAFLKSVLPEFDEDRVYVSDIKKLLKWYHILVAEMPTLFTEKENKE